MKAMSPRAKLNLTLFITLFSVFILSCYFLKDVLFKNAINETRGLSIMQMEMGQAIRTYTSSSVKPYISQTGGFHQISVPSFSANTTMKIFSQNHPEITYREVALNPTNLSNLANSFEADIIREFQNNSDKKEMFKITGVSEDELLHFSKPLKVTSETCLSCHGNPSVAPTGLLQQYGNKNGFNWRVGEVIGIQIVTIPTKITLKKAKASLAMYVGLLLMIASAVFVTLNIMLNKIVLNPMQKHKDKLEQISKHDFLTGILNRRGFEEDFAQKIQGQQSHLVSVILMDIDFFKKINDSFGHQVGDSVLKEFSHRINSITRRRDLFGRLGGEEFALILIQTNEVQALTFAEILRKTIQDSPFKDVGTVTSSFGVASMEIDDSLETLLHKADLALYEAKREGRNRVVSWNQMKQPSEFKKSS